MTPTTLRKTKIDSIMRDMGFDPDDLDSVGGLLHVRMSKLSDRTIDLIPPIAAMHKEDHQFKFLYSAMDHRNEQSTRELLFFHTLIPRLDRVMLSLFINGLRHIDYFKAVTEMETLRGRPLEVAVAFITVTSAMNSYLQDKGLVYSSEDDDSYMYIASTDLQDLLISAPDKADQLSEYISERRDGSPDALRAYIENTAGLRTGVL